MKRLSRWLRSYVIGSDLARLEEATTAVERLEGETAALSYVLKLHGEVLNVRIGDYRGHDFIEDVETKVKGPLKELEQDLPAKLGQMFAERNVTGAFEEAFREIIRRFQ